MSQRLMAVFAKRAMALTVALLALIEQRDACGATPDESATTKAAQSVAKSGHGAKSGKFKHGDWPFKPPQRPAVPAVSDASWVKNSIDAFILAKLEEKGLRPNQPADKRTLLRRI